MSEFLKKYGVWIGVGLVAVYLLFRGSTGGTAARPGVDPELAREELRQRGAAAERTSRNALEEARLKAQLDAQRLRDETERLRIANERARQDAAERASRAAQQAGILNSILGALGKILGGSTGQGTRTMPSIATPPTFPRATGSTSPGGTVPSPSLGPILFDPGFVPEFPTPNISSTFDVPDLTFDSGYSFANQGFYEAGSQAEFDYFNQLDTGGAGELTGVYPDDYYYASSQAEFDYFNQLEPGGGYFDYGGGGGDFYYPE